MAALNLVHGTEALKLNNVGGNIKSPYNHFSSYWLLLELILNTICSQLYSSYKDHSRFLKYDPFQQWPTLCSLVKLGSVLNFCDNKLVMGPQHLSEWFVWYTTSVCQRLK